MPHATRPRRSRTANASQLADFSKPGLAVAAAGHGPRVIHTRRPGSVGRRPCPLRAVPCFADLRQAVISGPVPPKGAPSPPAMAMNGPQPISIIYIMVLPPREHVRVRDRAVPSDGYAAGVA